MRSQSPTAGTGGGYSGIFLASGSDGKVCVLCAADVGEGVLYAANVGVMRGPLFCTRNRVGSGAVSCRLNVACFVQMLINSRSVVWFNWEVFVYVCYSLSSSQRL